MISYRSVSSADQLFAFCKKWGFGGLALLVSLYCLVQLQAAEVETQRLVTRLDAHLQDFQDWRNEARGHDQLLLEKVEDLQKHVAHIEGMLERELGE